MLLRTVGILGVALLVTVPASPAADARLRSPWDQHAVTSSDAPYTCPTFRELPRDFATNSYYSDSRHSIVDSALKKQYEASVSGVEDFSRMVVKAADVFQTSGSRPAAECTAALLAAAAKQKALAGTMEGHQAFYVQKWNLGAWALAYLKVRDSGVVPSDQSAEIKKWFQELAKSARTYVEDKRRHGTANDAYNNHLYWAGLAVAAVAVAENDRSLFRWAMDCYRQGVHDIAEDGTLPLEMARGQMALHYHLFSLAPLVMLAEFGEANGIDLYAESGYAIKRLVTRCVAGLENSTFFQQGTGVVQVTTSEIEPWQIGWALPYTRRFPDPEISRLLEKAVRLNYTMLGGLPPQ